MAIGRLARLLGLVLLAILPSPSVATALPGSGPGRVAPSEPAPGTWSAIAPPPNPDGRAWHQMAYAPELHLLFLFGGRADRTHFNGDVYWLDVRNPAAGWETLPPGAPGPAPRNQAAAAWDPAGHRLIVFGGQGALDAADPHSAALNGARGDLWSLAFDPVAVTPIGWTELDAGDALPGTAPPPRAAASAVVDTAGRRLLVYGGTNIVSSRRGALGDVVGDPTGVARIGGGLNDLWAYDLVAGGWTQLGLGPETTRGLFGHQAVYDPASHQMVVTGGTDDVSANPRANHETYGFESDTNTWTRWSPQGQSPGILDGAYGYSPELGAMLVMGGRLGDPALDDFAVFALKLGPHGEGSRWDALTSSGAPHRVRRGIAGALVTGPDRLFVFGGLISEGGTGDVYDSVLSAFDPLGERWKTVVPERETMRSTGEAAHAYDPSGSRLFVVGGIRSARSVWMLDLALERWSRVDAGGPVPEGTTGLAAAFDPVRDRLLVLGSGDRRLWTLDVDDPGARWERLETLGDAPPLTAGAMLYDPVRDRVLVVGARLPAARSFNSSQLQDDRGAVFALDLAPATPVWRELRPAGTPHAATRSAVAYDPRRNRVLVFGGRRPGTAFVEGSTNNELFELDFSGGADGAWRKLVPAGTPPSARADALGVVDAANDRFLVWAGAGDTGVHALDLGSVPPQWSEMTTTGDPAVHRAVAGAYDEDGRRLVSFGGFTDRGNEALVGSRDTYALSLGGGELPPPRPAAPEHALAPTAAPVRGGRWRPLGPPGAKTMAVAISPLFEQDDTVLAGSIEGKTGSRAAGLYLSRDRGATWTPADGAIRGAAVLRIAYAAADASRVYATAIGRGSRTPAYVSRNGGASWQTADDGLPNGWYYGLAVHPSDPDTAWVAGKDLGLYRTTDGGAKWDPADRGLEGQSAVGLVALPLPDRTRLLAATRDTGGGGLTGRGRVYLSDDGGETWDLSLVTRKLDDFDYDPLTYAFAADPLDAQHVLLAAGNGVWRSEDAGGSWDHLSSTPLHPAWPVFDPSSEEVYAGGVSYPVDFNGAGGGSIPPKTPGLFGSTDGGVSWDAVEGVPAEDIGGVAVSPDGGHLFAASLASGVYRSADGGQTWSHGSVGMTQTPIWGVAADVASPGRLLTVSNQPAVLTTTDDGKTWQTAELPEAVLTIAASPVRPGRLLAGTATSVYRSEDGGASWTESWRAGGTPMAQYQQPGGIAFDPHDEDTWYVTEYPDRISATRDNGSSFETYTIGDGVAAPLPVVVNPANTQQLFLGDAAGRGVYRSDDGGKTWARAAAGLDDGAVTALAMSPLNPGELWAGTLREGVYHTTDAGGSWAPARAGMGYRYVTDLIVDPADAGRLFAAADPGGVWESDEAGATWTRIGDGMPASLVIDLELDPSGRLLAATETAGVHVLDPGG